MRYYFFFILMLATLICLGQPCCFDPIRFSKDTSFVQKQTKLGLLETPNNEEWLVEIKYTKVVPPPPVISVTSYDNLNNVDVTYTGTAWYNGSTSASGFYKSSMAYANLVGNTINIKFTGKKIDLLFEQKVGQGRIGISIDGGVEGEPINLGISSSVIGGGVVKSYDLTQGFHTMKIRLLDVNKYVVFDGYLVTNQSSP